MTARVCDDAEVSGHGLVSGNVHLSDRAQVLDRARVDGEARVSGDAYVDGHGEVRDLAQVGGFAKVYDYGSVTGHAVINGTTRVREHASVTDHANVSGAVDLLGHVRVHGTANVSGLVRAWGDWAPDGGDINGGFFDGQMVSYTVTPGDGLSGPIPGSGTGHYEPAGDSEAKWDARMDRDTWETDRDTWAQHGLGTWEDARGWHALGFTPDDAGAWHREGHGPSDALTWGALIESFPPTLGPRSAANAAVCATAYQREGLTYDQVREWTADMPALAPDAIRMCTEDGITPQALRDRLATIQPAGLDTPNTRFSVLIGETTDTGINPRPSRLPDDLAASLRR